MTILLVDSDKEALDRETKRLTARQYAVAVSLYSDADDAIRFAMYHDVDVVFTRSVLAKMSGQELVSRIRQFNPRAECYILMKNEEVPFSRFLKNAPDPTGAWNAAGDPTQQQKNEAQENGQTDGQRMEGSGGLQEKGKKDGEHRMNEYELRGLGRKALLELMIEQGKELDSCKSQYQKDLEFLKSEHEKNLAFLKAEHEKEVASLQEALEQAREALRSREIAIEEAGSIAVAALQLNGVFEAAQAASQQYIENIRSLNERQTAACAQRDAENRAEVERRLKETEEKCADMESACKQKCADMDSACRQKCADMEAEAKQKAESYWAEVSLRLQSFYENHQELKRLLNL